jgi:alkanesulfonate monooxygenase SsuD/methylene tetrahydromethanopterin reductase-like flavin-dependent oxidoreductase (luciferase family)
MEPSMKLGINLPYRDSVGRPLDATGIASRAAMIENAGFEGIWQPDSLAPEVQPRPDPLAWLAVAASATNSVSLGTAIYIVPYRNPVELAQRALTLALVSNNRFVLGVGAGSNAAALSMAGVAFEDRFRILHHNMGVVRQLCRGESVGDNSLDPWPSVLGGPPLLLGAWHSEISLKRAVSGYDGWICSAGRTSLTLLSEGIARYRDLGGTRAVVATCSVDLTAPYKEFDPDAGFHLRCPPEAAAERLQMLVDLGFDEVGLHFVSAGAKRWEADPSEEALAEIRGLLPRG